MGKNQRQKNAEMIKKSTEKFYREARFEEMDSLFSGNYVYMHTYYETKRRAIENLDLFTAKNVLDVGCGQGHLLKLISESFEKLERIGADLNFEDLKRAKRRCSSKKCTFVLAEASCLPFIDESSSGDMESLKQWWSGGFRCARKIPPSKQAFRLFR